MRATTTFKPIRGLPGFELAQRPCLGRLIDVYESNYRLTINLVSGLRQHSGELVSHAHPTPDLHLRILDQSPYTTELSLTWFFDAEDQNSPEPDFRLRVAHDAGSAEVISFQAGGGVVVQGAHSGASTCRLLSTLDWKWQVNNFLNKWLRYCLECGHRFPATASRPTVLGAR